MTYLLIFLGGGLGSLTRFALDRGVQSLTAKTALEKFPLGILSCNLLGCFLIGCLFGYFTQKTTPAWVFPFLATGFLGGFTTFSTFAKETHALWSTGLTHLALLKVALSVILGLAALVIGLRLTHPA